MKVIMTHRAWWMSDESVMENVTAAEAQEFINTNQEHIDCSLWKYTMVDDNYVLYEAPPQTYAVFIDYKHIVYVLAMISKPTGGEYVKMKVINKQHIKLTPNSNDISDIKDFKAIEFCLNKNWKRQGEVCPECAAKWYEHCIHAVFTL